MASPTRPVGSRHTLYRMRQALARLPGGATIGPIDWELKRGRRIGVRCTDAQWEAFRSLLTGERSPAGGVLDEVTPVTVQTDVRLRRLLTPNSCLQDFLDSPDAPEFVWLDGRHHSLMVLVDLLELTPRLRRRPMKLGSAELVDRVWALRFVLSQADLLLARELFGSEDPLVHAALRRRWADWPGALVVGQGERPLPGPLDGWVRFDAEGRFSAGDGEPGAP
jgi:hypothetical protein